MNPSSMTLTKDLVWPWSLPGLILIAAVLAVLTIWTYRGVQGSTNRRLAMVLGLRLGALALACLMILRPSLAYKEELRVPSTLLIALDGSESMTIQDEADTKSRWAAMLRTLQQSEATFQQLHDNQNVNVVVYRFAEEAIPEEHIIPGGQADGKRTDFGKMLHSIADRHGADKNLRGLIIMSDGADNGTVYPALSEASRLRRLPCPVYTFALGKTTTDVRQRDIAMTAIKADPSPVPVKGKLTVTGTLDAPGFFSPDVTVRLFIDDKEVSAKEFKLPKETGNEVQMTADAPDKPGEIKVTLKADPRPDETVPDNNEISTYVTVIKEGISVLLVDKLRFPEPQRICDALSEYRSIRVFPVWHASDTPAHEDLLQVDKRHYDVIILGDLSARRLRDLDPQRPETGNGSLLAEIAKQVKERGAGLLVTGGYESLSNSDWQGTPLADVLPVELDAPGQVDAEIQMEPTAKGISHFLMRLTDNPEANKQLWSRLPKLDGMNRMGRPKPGAVVLAEQAGKGDPILVGMDYGRGRTLAFAADTTWRWQLLGQPKSNEGVEAHAHFWKQLIYWLAHQDKGEGSIQVKLDSRRLPAGGKLDFTVEMFGKEGERIGPNRSPRYEVMVEDPHKNSGRVGTAREGENERGHFWKTDQPGEYELVARGWYKDEKGQEVSGGEPARTRFLVYQDNSELMRRAADHDFLAKLANAGGGKFFPAEELPRFLRDLHKLPLPQGGPKANLWPDWRRHSLSGFLVMFLLLFVALLSTEWFLRRRWGMV
jgi:uncharacterized membrane protein